MQNNSKQSKAKQSNAKQCKAMQSNAKQCKAMQSNAKQCKTMQSKAKHGKKIQNNAKQSSKCSSLKQKNDKEKIKLWASAFAYNAKGLVIKFVSPLANMKYSFLQIYEGKLIAFDISSES